MSGLSAPLGHFAPAHVMAGEEPPAPEVPRDLPPVGHQPGGRAHHGRPRNPLRRRHLAVVGSALAVTLVLIVFARALADASLTNERAALHRAENARLQERLTAGRREVELVKGEPFLRLQARAYGYGEPGERVFGLALGAPPPAGITPLGAQPPGAAEAPPLEAWLELLFGP